MKMRPYPQDLNCENMSRKSLTFSKGSNENTEKIHFFPSPQIEGKILLIEKDFSIPILNNHGG
jgi:hypothetical protein